MAKSIQFVTIGDKKIVIENDNQLSSLPLLFQASIMQGWNGDKIHYDGISRQDAKLIADQADEAIDGILDGIADIAHLIGFVDIDDTGTSRKVNNAMWLISALSDLALSVKRERSNIKFYANDSD